MSCNPCKSIRQLTTVSAIGIVAWGSTLSARAQHTLGAPNLYSSQPYLRWDRSHYRNYAYQNFSNYHDHTAPYEASRRTFFGPMGNYLTTGYDLYKWQEVRTPGLDYGSRIFKPNLMFNLQWEKVYNSVVVFRDGYGNSGFSFIAGDNLIARLSPLTLSMTDFNGLRFDLSTPYLKATALASRIERPHTFQEVATTWAIEHNHFADDSTLLLGGRLQADLGTCSLGFNLSNSHVYRSTEPGNSLKGHLRPDQPLADWVIVRFADDSPRDGIAGAHIQEVNLVVNGVSRPDIEPLVVSNPADIQPQVGTVSTATGRFRATDYTLFRGHRLYYRGRDEIPLYSDYLVRRDHENGEDVSSVANVRGLLKSIEIESSDRPLAADGDKEITFLFDLSREPVFESVEIKALLGNDYRVDVGATLNEVNSRGKTYHTRYNTTFYETVVRAHDNVQDMSNLRWIRFHVGEDTGLFTYSADFNLTLVGLEINAEYTRSALYSRYPAHIEKVPDFRSSPRFSQKDDAFYFNATHWFDRGRVGTEIFSINPDFPTSYRTFLNEETFSHTNLAGMLNETMYWDLVEDNDDGDRFPDRRYGNLVGFTNDSQSWDLDGVHINQDEDNDGYPEINRDGDALPDYDEPFLLFDVEPNIYVYGLDHNNNNEPDHREDDGQVDYPYDPDQRGYHLFAQYDLTLELSLGMGHYSANETAGCGRNCSSYALLMLDIRGIDGHRLFFAENNLRRVQDDIADEYKVMDETPITNMIFDNRGLRVRRQVSGTPIFQDPPLFPSEFVADILLYQDSYVNESYMDLNLSPWSDLNLRQKLRVRFNWQQGGQLYNDTYQAKRRLDFYTSVSRLQFTKRWGKLSITPQYKFMLVRLIDRKRDVRLIAEHRSIPILRLEYRPLEHTSLRAGLQGIGLLPYRREDTTSLRESFEQHTAFVTVTNRTKYFGYELVTIVGVHKNRRQFDSHFQDLRNFDTLSLFVRALIGFTEYGRPI